MMSTLCWCVCQMMRPSFILCTVFSGLKDREQSITVRKDNRLSSETDIKHFGQFDFFYERLISKMTEKATKKLKELVEKVYLKDYSTYSCYR